MSQRCWALVGRFASLCGPTRPRASHVGLCGMIVKAMSCDSSLLCQIALTEPGGVFWGHIITHLLLHGGKQTCENHPLTFCLTNHSGCNKISNVDSSAQSGFSLVPSVPWPKSPCSYPDSRSLLLRRLLGNSNDLLLGSRGNPWSSCLGGSSWEPLSSVFDFTLRIDSDWLTFLS